MKTRYKKVIRTYFSDYVNWLIVVSFLFIISFVAATIRELGGVLGILSRKDDETDSEVDAILEERAAACAAKDWAKSDELRDKLRDMGIIVKDTPQGQQITKA